MPQVLKDIRTRPTRRVPSLDPPSRPTSAGHAVDGGGLGPETFFRSCRDLILSRPRILSRSAMDRLLAGNARPLTDQIAGQGVSADRRRLDRGGFRNPSGGDRHPATAVSNPANACSSPPLGKAERSRSRRPAGPLLGAPVRAPALTVRRAWGASGVLSPPPGFRRS